VLVANAAVGRPWAAHATGILAGLAAGVTFLFGALLLTTGFQPVGTAGEFNRVAFDAAIMVTGAAAVALVAHPIRERVARVVPIDPDNPVHVLAMVLGVILLGTQLASNLFSDVLAADQKLPQLTLGDLLSQELPLVVIAAAGIGLYMRRRPAAAAVRLGLVRPAWWQVALALAAAGAFFAFGQAMDALSHALTPQVAHRVDTTAQHLFGGLGTPVGIAALALLPGLCEEILFRGALQPRLGLIATALLFTSIHTQYGLSVDAASVFAIAVGLGLIRRYANTTTSCFCHMTYNLLVGIGISSALLGGALVAEAALIAFTAFAIWSMRRRAALPAGP